MDPGTYSYSLYVQSASGSTAVRTIVFNVIQNVAPPPQPTPTPVPTLPLQPTLAPSPQPTPTPVPTQPLQPTLAPAPVINFLNVSAETVQQGDLLVVSWSYAGESLAAATITRQNPDGTETPLLGGADVDAEGQYEDLMMTPGIHTYTLRVSSEFGETTVETVTVTVNPN